AGRLDLPRLALRPRHRAIALGQREVVQVERVLCVYVAPNVALAALGAAVLRHVELVLARLARVAELDGDVRITKLIFATEPLGHARHEGRLLGERLARFGDR